MVAALGKAVASRELRAVSRELLGVDARVATWFAWLLIVAEGGVALALALYPQSVESRLSAAFLFGAFATGGLLAVSRGLRVKCHCLSIDLGWRLGRRQLVTFAFVAPILLAPAAITGAWVPEPSVGVTVVVGATLAVLAVLVLANGIPVRAQRRAMAAAVRQAHELMMPAAGPAA